MSTHFCGWALRIDKMLAWHRYRLWTVYCYWRKAACTSNCSNQNYLHDLNVDDIHSWIISCMDARWLFALTPSSSFSLESSKLLQVSVLLVLSSKVCKWISSCGFPPFSEDHLLFRRSSCFVQLRPWLKEAFLFKIVFRCFVNRFHFGFFPNGNVNMLCHFPEEQMIFVVSERIGNWP